MRTLTIPQNNGRSAAENHNSEITPETNMENLRFTNFDAIFIFGGMWTYIADLVTDILVGFKYLRDRDYWWCGLTFFFVIFPSFTLQYLSLRWFVTDDQRHRDETHNQGPDPTQARSGFANKLWEWTSWLLTHVLQLGAVNRYIRTLRYGFKSRLNQKYYRNMVYEYRDVTMLRLIEAYTESAPQLVLQLYIMVKVKDASLLTTTSACVSLASLAWALEAYHKALRESRSDKQNVGYVALAVRIVWRLFVVASRVISLALFASEYGWGVFIVVGVHWVYMTVWLVHQKTDFCPTRFEEILFDIVIGIIYMFSYFNMKEGQTRYRMLSFYIIMFIENSVMFALWYYYGGRKLMYGLPALVFVWGGFFFGIIVMLFYYRCLHPSDNIRMCGGNAEDERDCSHVELGLEQVSNQDEVEAITQQASNSQLSVTADKKSAEEGNLFSSKGRRYLYWEIGIYINDAKAPETRL
ncbi:XK-related protein 6-like [Anneissia japonica]|uniref:XK-related protein 6-like n=1 Tax=Anneissia japonica TaxID=1529436 RepID=UPI0014259D99|nr:XK-related protein 6-like [Anneissia japonica]